MRIAGRILKLFGWSVEADVPDYAKCIICVAPHTSNWDFIIGKLAYASIGRKAGFLMKETWFFWPLGPIFKAIGGIPVPRGKSKGDSLTAALVSRFRESDRLVIAITPEGTRSRTSRWHTGFLRIALEADVPVVLGSIDFAERRVLLTRVFKPTGDLEADMRTVKDYYKPFTGKHPQNFTAE